MMYFKVDKLRCAGVTLIRQRQRSDRGAEKYKLTARIAESYPSCDAEG
jgi:hypothetical protein